MIIAVTGGSGFIGSYLLPKINKLHHNVLNLDIANNFDISDWNSVKDLPAFDICIHLAAKSFVPESYKTARQFYHLNIVGTLNMLEVCKKHNAKMIFISSYVYGKPQYLPVDEKHLVVGFNPYAHSKILGEELCQKYSSFFNVPIIIFRPFNVYGYGQRSIFLVPETIEKALQNNKVELLDPYPKRDIVHVDDFVDAIILSIRKNIKNEVFNIGSGVSYTVDKIAQAIFHHMPHKINVTYRNQKRTDEVDNVIADISKANNVLEWQPKITLEEGIKRTVNNYLG